MQHELRPSQLAAVEKVVSLIGENKKVISLAGPAGTGKTTLIRALLDVADGVGDVVVCTPTNKAAQVLNQKGIPATTFYRTFYTLEENAKRMPGQPPRFFTNRSLCERAANRRGGHWTDHLAILPEEKRAYAWVLIIDEASMLTSRRVRELEDMCDHLILVGDPHQLPPVGDRDCPAGYFAGLKYDVELSEVMRQAEGSHVLKLATAIRKGDAAVAEAGFKFFRPRDSFRDWVTRGAKTIVFTNKERIRINAVAREILGRASPLPEPGDLMVSASNYDETLINGAEVLVRMFEWDGVQPTALIQVDAGEGLQTVSMDMHAFLKDQPARVQTRFEETLQAHPHGCDPDEFAQFQFSYAVTAHKAQGSEWHAVVMIDQRSLVAAVAAGSERPGLPPAEQARRWAYTVVTRSRGNLAVAPGGWAR